MQKHRGIGFQGTPLPGSDCAQNNAPNLSNDMLGLGALLKYFKLDNPDQRLASECLNTVRVILNHLLHINRERHIFNRRQVPDFCSD